MSDSFRHGDLTLPLKRALVILLEDEIVTYGRRNWVSKNDRFMRPSTFNSLYDRYLTRIIVERGFRKRHVGRLTALGEYVALEVKRQQAKKDGGLSEDSARFIVQVTA